MGFDDAFEKAKALDDPKNKERASLSLAHRQMGTRHLAHPPH